MAALRAVRYVGLAFAPLSPASRPINAASSRSGGARHESIYMTRPSFKSKPRLLAPASLALLFLAGGMPAYSQNPNQNSAASSATQDEASLSGSVVSATRNTMVIRLDDGTYRLYTFDGST